MQGRIIIICVWMYFMCFASADSETISTSLNPSDMSALQKHVSFFDFNKDGIVYPSETFKGMRAIGCNIPLSAVASAIINAGLSAKTLPAGKGRDLRFPVFIENINKAKHGSDTGSFDTEGRFVPSKFEEIFIKHAHTHPNALTSDELNEMLKENRQPMDFAAGFASFLEWKILFFLCKDENGLLQKDTIRGVFDGSLFEQLAKGKGSAR